LRTGLHEGTRGVNQCRVEWARRKLWGKPARFVFADDLEQFTNTLQETTTREQGP
jgi:hypothetical protein